MGAGPCGLALALHLARAGLPVTLVESSSHPERAFRGEALMPSGLAALEALGLDALPASVPQRPLSGWSLSLEGRPLFTVAEPIGPGPACRLLDQGALLRHWLEQAAQLPNLQLLQGVAAQDLLWQDANSSGTPRVRGVRLTDGRELPAPLVIACDGRQSLLRQKADLPLESGAGALEVLWFRVPPDTAPAATGALAEALQGRFHTALGAMGSLVLYERADGGIQLGWVPEATEPPATGSPDWRQRFAAVCPPALAPLLAELPAAALERPLRLQLAVGLARSWQRPGLLLLGDAAHPMSPVRAQGLNMALRDALATSQVLRTVLAVQGSWDSAAQALDQALTAMVQRRMAEVRRIQALQQRELERGARLRQGPGLRQLLRASPTWIQPLLGCVWARSQRVLRQGLPQDAPSP